MAPVGPDPNWPTPKTQPRIALVIGNAKYEQTGWTLTNPARDADLMAKSLKDVGFDVVQLTDANRAAMDAGVTDFGRRLSAAGKSAVGVFFFAGHGTQIDGLNFLVPTDAHPREQIDMIVQGVRLDPILRYMTAAGNKINFVLLDACRNNPLPRAFRGSADIGLAEVATQDSVLISYATSPGAVAADGKGEANSPYTTSLAQYVKEDVVAEIMFKRIAAQVLYATKGLQKPWYESGLTAKSAEDDFYFNRYNGSTPRISK